MSKTDEAIAAAIEQGHDLVVMPGSPQWRELTAALREWVSEVKHTDRREYAHRIKSVWTMVPVCPVGGHRVGYIAAISGGVTCPPT